MAGEFAIINPRHRRRRKRSARAARPRRHRRRRHVARYANPRRRRRSYARRGRARARRRYSNPRMGLGGATRGLTTGISIGLGAVATNVASGYAKQFLPAGLQSGPGALAVKAGIGLVVLPLVLRFVPGGRRFAGPVAAGAGVAILLDLVKTYLAPSLPNVPGLADYESGELSDYQTGLLSGYGDPTRSESIVSAPTGQGVYGGSIYGGQ